MIANCSQLCRFVYCPSMFFRLARLAAILSLLTGPIASADPPGTQPPLTPTDVFRSFLLDIQLGDAADLPNLCSARQDESRALLRDFEAVASAMGSLRAAATNK